ncbi:tyrosine-type recombinase/integrase [Streptomyces sp. NRRL_ISP-5395]|nr:MULTISPECIES: tyrosine-type recombinase/integrase [Streptomyces]MDX2669303.1 tyrosine-type recombinase/integrase [Streptomyces sp. NRRL_ISP-5395]
MHAEHTGRKADSSAHAPGPRATAAQAIRRTLLFATAKGRGTSTRTEYDDWKELLAAAGVRDGCLHDARHTAATVLLILGVSGRAVMGLMGWSTTAMAARYQHMVDTVRNDIARQVDGLIWKPSGPKGERLDDDDGSAGALVPVG